VVRATVPPKALVAVERTPVVTDALARTVRRMTAVLVFALGLAGLALVRGNAALLFPLVVVPPLYLVVESVLLPVRSTARDD
jgi:hypothetical protein